MITSPVLLDTDILIDYAKGDIDARNVLIDYENKSISHLSRIELLCGMHPDDIVKTDAFLESNFDIYPLSVEVCKAASKIIAEHDLLLPNALLAATAELTGATVLTRDKRAYKQALRHIKNPYEDDTEVRE
tara:strand:+ start:1118 stop:1510 length:393 start_codon:yes stop_codon:yes gene_type:complete